MVDGDEGTEIYNLRIMKKGIESGGGGGGGSAHPHWY